MKRESTFREKYGQEFGTIALAYGRWQRSGMKEYDVSIVNGNPVAANILQCDYADGLVAALRNQPEEGKGNG